MTAGRPAKYANRHTLGIPGEKRDHELFMAICQREGVTPPDKINEWIAAYNRVHASGNPQFTLQDFIDNKDFKAVPATLAPKEDWLKFLFGDGADLEDIEQIEQVGKFLHSTAKGAKHHKLKEAAKSLKSGQKPKQQDRKALPETIDPDEARRQQLRALFRQLADPLHDRNGGPAHRARRNRVISHILALQPLLREYQRCQEYEEWEEGRK